MVTGLFAEKTATYLCSSEKDFCLELLTVDQQENKSLLNLGFFPTFSNDQLHLSSFWINADYLQLCKIVMLLFHM